MYALYDRCRPAASIHMYLHTYIVSFQPFSCSIATPRHHWILYYTLTYPVPSVSPLPKILHSSFPYTYIHLPAPRWPDTPIFATIHNSLCILYIFPAPLSTPVSPHPLFPYPYSCHHRLLQCLCPLSSTGGHVCMRACPGRGMNVCRRRVSLYFALSDRFLWPHWLRPCYQRWDRMDFMVGYLLRMICCHRFDLPLPVFRGSKGPIRMKLSLQQLRRP